MELREELRAPNKMLLKKVEPLNIPQFLLYGKPISFVETPPWEEPLKAELLANAMSCGETGAALTILPPQQFERPPEAEVTVTNIARKLDKNEEVKVGIPKECKRLAEVDFPIAVVSKHSAREKSIRHGHPSTLHLWWARRPLAACRAMLLGLLLPDPCDPHCPEDFKIKAREILPKVQGKVGQNDEDLRQAVLKFIGDFSNWDLSSNQTYLEVGRGLVKAAHPDETPLVVDPFAGGGSIPLEALRLGCEAFASDLNPVACLILKVMLEDIPRHGPELADELRRVGKEIKEAAERELSEFYPPDPDGLKPIAYLWARTVRCESPNCGAEIPLMRSFWLCKKANRKRALRYNIIQQKGEPPHADFEVFEPNAESEVPNGTVTRAKATCLCCGAVLPPDRVRTQLAAQRGGADVIFDDRGNRIGGARLLTVVTLKPGEQGRHYRLPAQQDYGAVWKAKKRVEEVAKESLLNGLTLIPDELLPKERVKGNSGFRVLLYGMETFGDLFTARQKLALVNLSRKIGAVSNSETQETVSLVIPKLAERLSSLVSWIISTEAPRGTFARQALPIVWDFLEMVPIVDEEEFPELIETMSRVIEKWGLSNPPVGQVQIADACEPLLSYDSAAVWFTDPPYYDAVAYADLSDFFFVWLKRTIPNHSLLHDPFDIGNCLTPKQKEIIQDPGRMVSGIPKDRAFFENNMAKAFAAGRYILRKDGLGCVVFAHKTTEGWEALLSGMTKGGWVITGSWPIATERPGRLQSQESAALATSIHLVCRPRPEDAPVGDWGEVLRELPKRVGDWMERLQSEGIRGADLVFACIGPALEIFSRYSKVVDAEEREIPLGGDPEATEPHRKGFLAYVWEVVGHTALEQVLGTAEAKARNSTAGALEEDARLTALFLWTLQSTNGNGVREKKENDEETEEDEEDTGKDAGATKKKKGYSLIFDVVRRFAQPLGIHLPEWEGRIIETEKGVVRLLSVKERTKQLFGEESISVAGIRIEEQARRDPQMKFDFAITSERGAPPKIKGHHKRKEKGLPAETAAKAGTTTLDRVHAAMLLQSSGQTNALRALLKAEQDHGPDFLRLANALSALYPKDSEEKRLVDAMLLAMPRA
jgi:adenine-specific DNA methylase